MDKVTLGQRIRMQRKAQKLTLEKLAERADIGLVYIQSKTCPLRNIKNVPHIKNSCIKCSVCQTLIFKSIKTQHEKA